MRDEISAGIKNALERGESLEEAIQSFINAGYNPVEVREAANNIAEGASSVIYPKAESKSIQQPQQAQVPVFSSSQVIASQQISQPQTIAAPTSSMPLISPIKKNSSPKKKMILLIIFLIFVILLLALFLIYKEQVLDSISSLLS